METVRVIDDIYGIYDAKVTAKFFNWGTLSGFTDPVTWAHNPCDWRNSIQRDK